MNILLTVLALVATGMFVWIVFRNVQTDRKYIPYFGIDSLVIIPWILIVVGSGLMAFLWFFVSKLWFG